MTRSVLLLSTASQWLGTARMPRALARAGFDVALLAPTDSLAAKSRYVSRAAFLSATATPMEWLLLLVRTIDAVAPDVLVPCDEMAVRLLFTVALEPPRGIDAGLQARLVALITKSIGEPRHFAASIDKTLLPAAAEELGIPMPPCAVASRVEDAVAHAARLGYPVVLKRRFGFAGQGVAVVATRDELVAAATRLLRPDQLDLGGQREPRLLVQSYIAGPHHSQALVAFRGEPLASFAWERHVATDPVKGQTAVVRFVRSPGTRANSEALCRGLRISGFCNVQFIVDEVSGAPYLLEINRRVVTHMHMGERVGRDLPRALLRALEGLPPEAPPTLAEEPVGTVVVFPREWLRDPHSRHLVELPVDVPWDDPALVQAMLALRRDA
jgi:glutathione synthase/RimK-type ligase-like ATP-grasp enzyme